MTSVEENSLKTQIELYKQLISNNNMIEYYVSEVGKTITNKLCEIRSENDTVTYNKTDIHNMINLLNKISNTNRWNEFDGYSNEYYIKNKVIIETLSLLQKQ